MEKQEVLDLIKEIGTIEDDVERRGKLAELTDEVSKGYESLETLTAENETLTKDNERIRQQNMDLYLRVGEPKKEEGNGSQGSGDREKRKFEDLFDEKGGIK